MISIGMEDCVVDADERNDDDSLGIGIPSESNRSYVSSALSITSKSCSDASYGSAVIDNEDDDTS